MQPRLSANPCKFTLLRTILDSGIWLSGRFGDRVERRVAREHGVGYWDNICEEELKTFSTNAHPAIGSLNTWLTVPSSK
jgi:hypothetical protein